MPSMMRVLMFTAYELIACVTGSELAVSENK